MLIRKQLARSYLDIFEKLLEMLHKLSRELELFETYARLYPTSSRLNFSLANAYEAYLEFCLASKNLLNKGLRSSKCLRPLYELNTLQSSRCHSLNRKYPRCSQAHS